MHPPLSLLDYEISVFHHEGVARVAVTRGGETLLDAQVRAVSEWVPFRFNGPEGEILAIVSTNGRQGALGQPGRLLATKGRSPDFWKMATSIFVPGRHLIWTFFAVFKNLLIGVLLGFAVVWGLFSSLDSTWILVVSILVFGGSYAIDQARDRRVLEGLRHALS